MLRTWPSVCGLLKKGDAIIFDSRLIHLGGANLSPCTDRVLFCATFRNPEVPRNFTPALALASSWYTLINALVSSSFFIAKQVAATGNPASIRPMYANELTLQVRIFHHTSD
jgi:hypothetical protein